MLHHDRILFEQLILRASDSLGIEAGIVEKDYGNPNCFIAEMIRRNDHEEAKIFV